MFEQMSYCTLQHYWWLIIAILGGLLAFLFFVQGGQTLFSNLAKTNKERTLLVNALGRKWEFTFTTLVVFGGAMFASFPLFYSVSFGGAYWMWMIILFVFVLQAVSYQFRSKPGNWLGQSVYDGMLYLNGCIGTIFIGTMIATFFTGAHFSTDLLNHVSWDTPYHGLEALLVFHNLSLGLAVFFLSRILALHYFTNSIHHEEMLARTPRLVRINAALFLIFFLFFIGKLFLMEGYAIDSHQQIGLEAHKYLYNFIEMPIVGGLFLIGVLLVLYSIFPSSLQVWTKSIWYSAIGTILTVSSLIVSVGYNQTAFYPSLSTMQSSLTLSNACSSKFTLLVMGYVSLLIPFIFLYIFYTWRMINKKKITTQEMDDENNHAY